MHAAQSILAINFEWTQYDIGFSIFSILRLIRDDIFCLSWV